MKSKATTTFKKSHEKDIDFHDRIKTIFSRIQNQVGKRKKQDDGFFVLPSPNEASIALGGQLANTIISFMETLSSKELQQSEKNFSRRVQDIRDLCMFVLERLCDEEEKMMINPSIYHSFFHVMEEKGISLEHFELLDIWTRWLSYCEDVSMEKSKSEKVTNLGHSSSVEILAVVAQHYARFIHSRLITTSNKSRHPDDALVDKEKIRLGTNDILEHISQTYIRTKLSMTKECLIREFLSVSFDNTKSGVELLTKFLSPLASTCLVSTKMPAGKEEANLFISCLMRECAFAQSQNKFTSSDDWLYLMEWMTKILDFHMTALLSSDSTDVMKITLEMGYDFLTRLLDMIISLVDLISNKKVTMVSKASQKVFSNVLDCILGEILPMFFHSIPLCQFFPLKSTLTQLSLILNNLEKELNVKVAVSDITLFRICSTSLAIADSTHVKLMLKIIGQLCDNMTLKLLDSVFIGSVLTVGCIFLPVPLYAQEAQNICKHAKKAMDERQQEMMTREAKTNYENHSPKKYQHFIQLFGDKQERGEFMQVMKYMSGDNTLGQTILSVSEQCELILFGLSLLSTYARVDADLTAHIFSFLGNILKDFSNLGIRTLPVVMFLIQNTAHNYGFVVQSFEFLCTSLSHDPYCAHEIWNTLVSLTTSHTPINVQSMVIRLFPLLCKSNKRLYSRVRNTLGAYTSHPNAELRLASSVTICDLAKEDLIRDVSDVVGWVQSLLLDEEEVVVHHAILSLHHFVVNEELDYDMVVKVLNKKLVNISDVNSILELDEVIIEALVIFLGDGNINACSDSESESIEEETISPQIKTSVESLIQLALFPELHKVVTFESKLRILNGIYKSLSNYSISYLGLDQEIIRSCASSMDEKSEDGIIRYNSLKKVVMEGLVLRENISIETESISHLEHLASKLVIFEENTLGSSLWKKRKSSTRENSNSYRSRKISKSATLVLPKSEEVERYYFDDPNDVTAISSLLCFRGNEKSDVNSILDEVADMVNDMQDLSSDPLVRVLALQSWINSMQEIWRIVELKEKEIESTDVVHKILDWRKTLEVPDSAFVALAAFSLALTDPSISSGANDLIYNTIMSAHEESLFEDENLACSALGITALKLIQTSSLSGVCKIIDFLEEVSTRCIESGNFSFEASFCLGFIAQSLYIFASSPTHTDSVSSSLVVVMIQRIISVLLEEINASLVEDNPLLQSFIACVKSGSLTTDLVERFSNMETNSLQVQDGSKQKAKASCIALGLAVSSMLHLKSDYVRGTYYMLMCLPEGCGKGLAISATFGLMSKFGIATTEDTSRFREMCQEDLSSSGQGINNEDLFFVLSRVSEIFDVFDEFEMPWYDKILFSDHIESLRPNVKATAILAMTQEIGSVPAISGTQVAFYRHSFIKTNTTETKISLFVQKLSTIIDDENENKSVRDTAILSLGILSSMKYGISEDSFSSIERKSSLKLGSSSAKRGNKLGQEQEFPEAIEGSLVNLIVESCKEKLDKIISRPFQDVNAEILAYHLSLIKEIAIPSSFSRLLGALIKWEGEKTVALKEVCIDILTFQVSMERRASSERQEYLKLSLSLAKQPAAFFHSIMGPASGRFLSRFYEIIPHWSTKNIIESISNLWIVSCEAWTNDNLSDLIISLLKSFKCILFHESDEITRIGRKQKNTIAVSPAVRSKVQSFLLTEVFAQLCCTVTVLGTNEKAEKSDASKILMIWSSYFSCLEEIPFQFFEKSNFFSFQTNSVNENMFRAFAVSHLSQKHLLEGNEEREIAKSLAWISRQSLVVDNSNEKDKISLWLASISLSMPRKISAIDSKKYMISNYFESMLVNGLNSQTLKQLATEINALFTIDIPQHEFAKNARMCIKHSLCTVLNSSFNSLSGFVILPASFYDDLSSLTMSDLPLFLGFLNFYLKNSSTVTNKAIRILFDHEQNKEKIKLEKIRCLERIVLSCRDRQFFSNIYATFVTSLLATQK